MVNRSLNEVIKDIPFTKEISKASDGVVSISYEQLLQTLAFNILYVVRLSKIYPITIKEISITISSSWNATTRQAIWPSPSSLAIHSANPSYESSKDRSLIYNRHHKSFSHALQGVRKYCTSDILSSRANFPLSPSIPNPTSYQNAVYQLIIKTDLHRAAIAAHQTQAQPPNRTLEAVAARQSWR